MRQRVKRYGFGALAFIGVLAGVGKLSLGSDFATRQFVARIQTAIGAPIRLVGSDLGYSSSSLSGVEVLEIGPTCAAPSWSSARTVEANLSLWQLLRGDLASGSVTFHDAAVTLRFDRNNFLLTRLPAPPPDAPLELPLIRVENGSFTLRRENAPDEVFHNIHLELRGDAERLALSGTVDDPDWGLWTVSGGRATANDPLTMTLRTVKEVHVTPALLKRTPFVPATAWDAVELEGDTNCELTLRFEPDGRVRYRVVLEPHDTSVKVQCIELQATSARGRVVVEDDVLTLEDVRGLAAGGDVKVASTMDFRGSANVLQFAIEVTTVNPKLLPKTWAAPAINGKVNGRADLEVTIRDGRTTVRCRGEGSAKVLPLLPAVPLRLESNADGNGIHFTVGGG